MREDLLKILNDICMMNADGSNLVIFEDVEGVDRLPVWIGDSQIAFFSFRDGNWGEYIMSFEGNNRTSLTKLSIGGSNPSWSSDGSKIVYSSQRVGLNIDEIYVINADGTNERAKTIWEGYVLEIGSSQGQHGEHRFLAIGLL